jgi:hypothetical protein
MRCLVLPFKKSPLISVAMSFKNSSQKSVGKGSGLGRECVTRSTPEFCGGIGW